MGPGPLAVRRGGRAQDVRGHLGVRGRRARFGGAVCREACEEASDGVRGWGAWLFVSLCVLCADGESVSE